MLSPMNRIADFLACVRRLSLVGVLLLFLVIILTPPGLAQEGAGSPPSAAAANPLESRKTEIILGTLEERARVVGLLMLDTSREYRRVAVEKAAVLQEMQDVQAELDREAIRVRDLTLERLEVVRAQNKKIGQRYVALDSESNRLLESLRFLLRERDVLTRRIADLRSNLPREEEMLSGVWEVSWYPAGISGTFYLDQSGTLVTGQYRLGSVGSGSLRGTFVGSKLYLERVDAERGRDAELEGYLDPDGARIRGTWQAFELVQGGLPHGQWVARRVE